MGVPGKAVGCLRLGIALQCVAAAYLAEVHPSPVNSYLLIFQGWSDSAAGTLDRGAAVLLLLTALLLLLPTARVPRWAQVGALAAAGWMAAVALATYADRGHPFAYLAPAAHMVRYGAPVVAVVWCWSPISMGVSRSRRVLGEGFLRISLASTFLAHGVEALAHLPDFVDLTLGGARRAGWGLDEAGANLLLTIIGSLDVLLAFLIVFRRWRWVTGYMAAWGLLTALSRLVHSGPASWPLTLLRAGNFMCPLALWFLWSPDSQADEKNAALDSAPDVLGPDIGEAVR